VGNQFFFFGWINLSSRRGFSYENLNVVPNDEPPIRYSSPFPRPYAVCVCVCACVCMNLYVCECVCVCVCLMPTRAIISGICNSLKSTTFYSVLDGYLFWRLKPMLASHVCTRACAHTHTQRRHRTCSRARAREIDG